MTRLVWVLVLAACQDDPSSAPPVEGPILGRAVDLDGDPLGGVRVRVLEGETWGEEASYSNPDGYFETASVTGNVWLRAEADGFHSRVRPASPSETLLVRLSEDDGQTVRLQFLGDTMFGRRYYGDEDTEAPLIRSGFEFLDIPAVLEPVAPLFEEAHITSVNLETPLTLGGGNPHPTKDYWYHSHPATLGALAQVGIDFANLGNNHVYDYLEDGTSQTLGACTSMGFPCQGAGLDEAEAWEPEILETSSGVRVGFVGCTTITGSQHAITYVADDDESKGGAAPCEDSWLEAAVGQAVEDADIVVVQIHGGYEYALEPSGNVTDFSEAAIGYGAHLVVNHHPHVLQGLDTYDDRLIAWSMGNFAFDQELWVTYPSALLEVYLGTDGSLRRAYVEPLLVEDYQPRGVRGWPQRHAARHVAGLSGIPVAQDDGALEVDLRGASNLEETSLSLGDGGEDWSFPTDVREGWVDGITVSGADTACRMGRDILVMGDFEDVDLDDEVAEGSLWQLDSTLEQVTDAAAHQGYYGLRLTRDYASVDPVYANPQNRLPLDTTGDTRDEITVAGWLRTEGDLEIQLSWYPDTEGESSSQDVVPLDPTGSAWASFHFEAQVPEDAVAVGLYLRLQPPDSGTVEADVDDLRVIEWWSGDPTESLPADPARYDQFQVRGTATAHLVRRVLPGLYGSSSD